MKKPWITSTIGPDVIQTGVPATYRVGSYKETEGVDLDAVYWKLYVQEGQGWRELKGEKHKGAVTTFIFTNTNLIGKPIMVEAYGSNPEMSSPPGKIVELQQGPATIESIGLYDLNGNSITEPLKYGQTLLARIMTVNMIGETLNISLWERDSFSDVGHDAEENQKLWTGTETVPRSGEVKVKIPLTPAMAEQANNNWFDRNTHEYYLLVENDITLNRYSIQTVEVDNEVLENAPSTTDALDATSSLDPGVGTLTPPTTTPPSTPSIPPSHPPETVSQGTTVPVQGLGTDPPGASGNSEQTVDRSEAIVDAYFAKEEKGPTDEAAGTVSYEIQNPTRDKSIETIAKEIKEIVDGRENTNDKYVKLDKLIEKLNIIAERNDLPWSKGTNIGVPLFKLGPVMTKVSSDPLNTKLYLVADTQGMDGIPVKIKILEKDGLIQGSPDAELPALKLSVAQMEEDTTSESEEAEGVQQTQFIATVENNQIAIPIHLRPKKNEELTQWQEKIQKGVKDDATYTYTIENGFSIPDEAPKNRFAEIIAKNINQGTKFDRPQQGNNPKLSEGQKVYAEDVKAAFGANTEYGNGASISNIAIYKKSPELLYLKATPQPSDTLDEFFLNENENSYFVVGNQCPRCKADITLEQIEELFGVHASSTAFRTEVVKYLNEFIKKRRHTNRPIHIDTCLRKAHFFAQVGAETSGISTDWIVETDVKPYSPGNIRNRSLFGERGAKLDRRGQVELFCAERPQIRLLSFLYAHENGFGNGNGNEASGDGYKFRGRGLKQLTGRGNYRDAAETLQDIFPDEYVDLEAEPDKVKEAKYAVLSAIAYWEKHKIWEVADTITESTDENIKKIRRTVNGGTAGWKDAKKYFEDGIAVFRVNECSPVETDSGVWREPIDNPQIAIYTQGGLKRPWRSAFGDVRRDIRASGLNHAGLDLFAEIGTNVYSSLPGKVIEVNRSGGRAGIYLKIKVLSEFVDKFHERRRNYTPYYIKSNRNYTEPEYGIDGYPDFKEYVGITNSEEVIFMYMHLSSVSVNVGDIISESEYKTKVIAKTGDTGASGTKGPHLHFEIRDRATSAQRYNPAYYVNYKNETELTTSERSAQDNQAT